MTPAETARLLAKVAAYDRRTVGAADVAAWTEAVGDLPFDVAAEAVRRHFRESTEYLMPAHVRTLARQVRADRDRASAEALALPSRFEPDPSRDVRISAGLSAVQDVLAAIRRRLEAQRQPQGEPSRSDLIRQRAIERAAAQRRLRDAPSRARGGSARATTRQET